MALQLDEGQQDCEKKEARCRVHHCAGWITLCIVAPNPLRRSFAATTALRESFISRLGSLTCFWAGILCALLSAYFFLIAPIEDVVLAITLFGGAVGLEVVAALLKRGKERDPPAG